MRITSNDDTAVLPRLNNHIAMKMNTFRQFHGSAAFIFENDDPVVDKNVWAKTQIVMVDGCLG